MEILDNDVNDAGGSWHPKKIFWYMYLAFHGIYQAALCHFVWSDTPKIVSFTLNNYLQKLVLAFYLWDVLLVPLI